MNWNIFRCILYSRLFLLSLVHHTEWNYNWTFYAWEGSFWVPTHIFIQHLVFMAVFDWILGWCQFTPPGVPIHPSCANSPRPVVNFIFFNKTKTEVPEVLKMYMRRAFMHSSHAYMLQPSSWAWLRWRRSKKGCQFAPLSPKLFKIIEQLSLKGEQNTPENTCIYLCQ